jgi:hypothetical protein
LTSSLEYHASQLRKNQERLFISAVQQADVSVFEASISGDGMIPCRGTSQIDKKAHEVLIEYESSKWESIEHVKGHLDRHLIGKDKDPRIRYLYGQHYTT